MQLLERLGAQIINIGGGGIILDSGHRWVEGLQTNSLAEFTAGAGELVLGALVIVLADEWKKKMWKDNKGD